MCGLYLADRFFHSNNTALHRINRCGYPLCLASVGCRDSIGCLASIGCLGWVISLSMLCRRLPFIHLKTVVMCWLGVICIDDLLW